MREGTGTAGAVAGAITAFFVALAGLVAATTYLLVCIYAIVKLVGDREGHPDPATLIVGFVLLVTALVAGLLVGVRYLGRSLSSRSRTDPDVLRIQ
jgi:protein-S-isoprenylcysteine O-methyltransferase Ste14